MACAFSSAQVGALEQRPALLGLSSAEFLASDTGSHSDALTSADISVLPSASLAGMSANNWRLLSRRRSLELTSRRNGGADHDGDCSVHQHLQIPAPDPTDRQQPRGRRCSAEGFSATWFHRHADFIHDGCRAHSNFRRLRADRTGAGSRIGPALPDRAVMTAITAIKPIGAVQQSQRRQRLAPDDMAVSSPGKFDLGQ